MLGEREETETGEGRGLELSACDCFVGEVEPRGGSGGLRGVAQTDAGASAGAAEEAAAGFELGAGVGLS